MEPESPDPNSFCICFCIHLKAFIFRYFDIYEHLHTNSIYSLSKIASGYRTCRYGKLNGIVISIKKIIDHRIYGFHCYCNFKKASNEKITLLSQIVENNTGFRQPTNKPTNIKKILVNSTRPHKQ